MKILHVISSPRAEGTVRLTLDWLQAPAVGRQSVMVLASTPADLTQELKGHAWAYHEMRALPAGWAKFPWLVWQTCRVAVRERPDLVICWNTGFSGPVLLGAFLAGARRLLAHAGNPPDPHSNLRRRLYGLLSAGTLSALGARVVCCSLYVARGYRDVARFPAAMLCPVWNCAQVERIRARARAARAAMVPREQPVIIMVATLEAHKDHATLLAAMVRVRRSRPLARLWLAGDGSLRTALEGRAADLGIDDVVTFLGTRKDIPELLGQADLFVFSTTRQEGLGTVLVEALAAGLPIVATDVPACREMLQGGRWGRLVPEAGVDELAAAIETGLQAAGGRGTPDLDRYLARFSVEAMQAAYLSVARTGSAASEIPV